MRTPRLALGLFVYNGQQHLAAAVESLLSQSMGDFVLDISDNGSTDQTEDICRSYAAADDRVHYVRHDQNRGPTWNTNFVTQVSPDTEFFKWCAHDDVCEPTYLEQCVTELDFLPEVVVSHTRARYIDEQGDEIMRSFRQQDFTDDRPWMRFREVLLGEHDYTFIFGVIRRSALRRIRPFQSVYAGDAVLLAELAFQGRFAELPDHLCANRVHTARATASLPKGRSARTWAEWFGGSSRFALWHTWEALRQGISMAPLDAMAKARSYGVLADWMALRWKGLGWELASDGREAVAQRITAIGRGKPAR